MTRIAVPLFVLLAALPVGVRSGGNGAVRPAAGRHHRRAKTRADRRLREWRDRRRNNSRCVNYTYFGNGDKAHWLGFDLIVLFNDSFFMACMFLISGLFVRESLTRRGAANYLANRAWRLGVPYLVSIFVLMPLAYYPTFCATICRAPPTSTSFISGGAR